MWSFSFIVQYSLQMCFCMTMSISSCSCAVPHLTISLWTLKLFTAFCHYKYYYKETFLQQASLRVSLIIALDEKSLDPDSY